MSQATMFQELQSQNVGITFLQGQAAKRLANGLSISTLKVGLSNAIANRKKLIKELVDSTKAK